MTSKSEPQKFHPTFGVHFNLVQDLSTKSLDDGLLIANQIEALQALEAGDLATYQTAIDGVHVHGLAICSNLGDATSDHDNRSSRSRFPTALINSRHGKRVLTARKS